MKKIYLIMGLLIPSFGFSQIGINIKNPDQSSALEIASTNKGVLIPRLSKVQKDSIENPAVGLLIFQTEPEAGFYYFDGSSWKALLANLITSTDIQDGTINTEDLSEELSQQIHSTTLSISTQTTQINLLSTTLSNFSDNDTLYEAGNGLSLEGTTFHLNSNVVTSSYAGDVSINGTVTATKFVGDGSGLTGISNSSSIEFLITQPQLNVSENDTSSEVSYESKGRNAMIKLYFFKNSDNKTGEATFSILNQKEEVYTSQTFKFKKSAVEYSYLIFNIQDHPESIKFKLTKHSGDESQLNLGWGWGEMILY